MYSNIEPGDLDLSGPSVWPRVSSERMSDLVIHKRPELTYLEALRRKEKAEAEIGEKFDHVLVTVYELEFDRDKKKLSSTAKSSSKFWHFIRKEDRGDDVRKFLSDLRSHLERLMPNHPDPMLGVKISFCFEGRWAPALATFTTRWV